jgi:hypothetical protein
MRTKISLKNCLYGLTYDVKQQLDNNIDSRDVFEMIKRRVFAIERDHKSSYVRYVQ